jgi:hypothetical protein
MYYQSGKTQLKLISVHEFLGKTCYLYQKIDASGLGSFHTEFSDSDSDREAFAKRITDSTEEAWNRALVLAQAYEKERRTLLDQETLVNRLGIKVLVSSRWGRPDEAIVVKILKNGDLVCKNKRKLKTGQLVDSSEIFAFAKKHAGRDLGVDGFPGLDIIKVRKAEERKAAKEKKT